MKKTKRDEASQRTLFRKAARELGADESEAHFDAALKTVAKQKPKALDTPKNAAKDHGDQ